MSSFGEIAMLVNDNFSKPLNVQIRELKYSGAYLITGNKSFTPDRTGWYKIICVGCAGTSNCITPGNMYYQYNTGGAGGVAISTLHLEKSNSYDVVVDSSVSSFENIQAFCGDETSGGDASGGDYNYKGNSGLSSRSMISKGADAGVYIPELMRSIDSSGQGILGYGVSLGVTVQAVASYPPKKEGCVLIIPLEMEG